MSTEPQTRCSSFSAVTNCVYRAIGACVLGVGMWQTLQYSIRFSLSITRTHQIFDRFLFSLRLWIVRCRPLNSFLFCFANRFGWAWMTSTASQNNEIEISSEQWWWQAIRYCLHWAHATTSTIWHKLRILVKCYLHKTNDYLFINCFDTKRRGWSRVCTWIHHHQTTMELYSQSPKRLKCRKLDWRWCRGYGQNL